MVLRRDLEEADEHTFYLTHGPAGSAPEELARTAGKRWKIEETFEQAKGEAGLEEYEVRKWESW